MLAAGGGRSVVRVKRSFLRLSLAVLAVMASLPMGAAAATSVSGKLADGTLPPTSKGAAVVRAVSPGTTVISAGGRVRSGGRYSLTVDPGVLMVIADVVRTDRKARTAVTPVFRARKGKRKTVRVSLKRTRPVRPARKAAAAAGPIATRAADGPAVAVKWFSGSGPEAVLGRGLADMLATDFVSRGEEKCGLRVVEWNHRDLIQQELDLQEKYEEYFDPSTVVKKNWVEPTVFVQGSVTTTDAWISWNIQMVDAKTGKTIGGDSSRVPADGDAFFDAESTLTDRLLDQLCPRRYEVTVDLTTQSRWPAVSSSGTVHAVLTATGNGTPATSWTGAGTMTYQGVSFTSGVPECTWAPENTPTVPWKVTLMPGDSGMLSVAWSLDGDLYATSIGTCTVDGHTATAPGQPGPRLQDPIPLTFTVPIAGGSQAISGGVDVGGSGWFHTGTLTVRRLDQGDS